MALDCARNASRSGSLLSGRIDFSTASISASEAGDASAFQVFGACARTTDQGQQDSGAKRQYHKQTCHDGYEHGRACASQKSFKSAALEESVKGACLESQKKGDEERDPEPDHPEPGNHPL